MFIEYGENKNLLVAKGFLMTQEEFDLLLLTLIRKTNMEEKDVYRSLMKYVIFIDRTGYDVTFNIPNILVYSKMFYVEEEDNIEMLSLNELNEKLKQQKKIKKENEVDFILKDTIRELILEDKIKYWINAKDAYSIDCRMKKKSIKQLTFVANQKSI